MKTDSQLQQDILAELKWDPAIDATLIGVEVRRGAVTLTGQVSSYGATWDAERAAQRVSGVDAISVDIAVALPGSAYRNDAEISAAARNALERTIQLPADRVNVLVEEGWITLSGDLGWPFQRHAAMAAVRHLVGVRGVTNSINVEPSAPVVPVRSAIEASLQRRTRLDASRVLVEVVGTEVTLRGTVHTFVERALARECAWGTAGVRHVVDKISVFS